MLGYLRWQKIHLPPPTHARMSLWALPGGQSQTHSHSYPQNGFCPVPESSCPYPPLEEGACFSYSPTSPARRRAGQTCGL